MGADALAHGVAVLSGCSWFSVRKEPKGHGRTAWVEGARLGDGDRVVIVEDVVSTGASLLKAVERVSDLGAVVVAATGSARSQPPRGRSVRRSRGSVDPAPRLDRHRHRAALGASMEPGPPEAAVPATRPLEVDDLGPDPIEAFRSWWDDAFERGQPEPEAAALATATPEGHSSVRFVLLRGFDRRGFVFYTNGRSRKGSEMAATGWASMAFRWAAVNRQVRVAGPVAEVDPKESDDYFDSRPRGSQLGAWASVQSEELGSRAELEARLADVDARYLGRPVPRPPWWGGYRIDPVEIEFWQQGEYRLHDRFRYTRSAGTWSLQRLHP